jgi:hypothetical protein
MKAIQYCEAEKTDPKNGIAANFIPSTIAKYLNNHWFI